MRAHTSEYYQYLPSARSLPARIAALQRRRMFDKLVETFGLDPSRSILDVGVTRNESYGLDNYLEALYSWKEKITASGLEDGSHLERRYPGLRFVQPSTRPASLRGWGFRRRAFQRRDRARRELREPGIFPAGTLAVLEIGYLRHDPDPLFPCQIPPGPSARALAPACPVPGIAKPERKALLCDRGEPQSAVEPPVAHDSRGCWSRKHQGRDRFATGVADEPAP